MRNRILYSLLLVLVSCIPARGQSDSIYRQKASPGRGLVKESRAATKPYRAITARERVRWVIDSTVGQESLLAGVLSAGLGTGINRPKEYGPTWGGFGQRYGIRLTGISTGNAIEVSLGAIWSEDPRYNRLPNAPFGTRVRNVIKFTFAARYRDGHLGPAYARLLAISGNNILSDTWRVNSETQIGDTALRTLGGILGRMGANAFAEFWPNVRRRIFGH